MQDYRRCEMCSKLKPKVLFAIKPKSKKKREKHCMDCKATYKAHWRNQQPRSLDRRPPKKIRPIQREKLRKLAYQHLLSHTCIDCGEDDVVVLEFDHVRGKKSFGISQAISMAVGVEDFVNELEKCAVRCCNCHRRRTAYSKGYKITEVWKYV